MDIGLGHEVSSTLQVNVLVKKRAVPAVEWIARVKGSERFTVAALLDFYWDQQRIFEGDKGEDVEGKPEEKVERDEVYITQVLRVLAYNGCINLVEEEERK